MARPIYAPITVCGNLTGDPKVKWLDSGDALATFSVAVNRLSPDGKGGYTAGDGEYYNVRCWRDLAEHVADSVGKGDHVVVLGEPRHRSWEDDDGQRRQTWVIEAADVAVSLRWQLARAERARKRDPDRYRPMTDEELAGR